jgi:hypothetical protein
LGLTLLFLLDGWFFVLAGWLAAGVFFACNSH